MCLYWSTLLADIKDNSDLLKALDSLPVVVDEELVIVGDVNLPHVDWDKGLVKQPLNSIDKRLLMEAEYMNVAKRKGINIS